MQKNNKFKNNLTFLFILCSVSLLSQKPLSINLQFHHGMTALERDNEFEGYLNSHRSSIEQGSDFSLGLGVNYFQGQNRRFSFSGSILWNYYAFQRKEDRVVRFIGGGAPYEEYFTGTFQCHSILIPLKINLRFYNFGLSYGLVTRKRLRSKFTIESLIGTTNLDYHKVQFYTGEENPLITYPSDPVNFESQIDLQYLVGINYRPNAELTFSLEYRNLIVDNPLIGIGTYFSKPNSATISLGMSYKIF